MEEELERLRATLAQVHNDSREIEAELEAEIVAREAAHREVEKRLSDALAEASSWKAKCTSLQRSNDKLEIELDSAQEELRAAEKRIHALESVTDDLELDSRVSQGTLQSLEAENHRLMEALALKEVDVTYHQQLTEELQHTKQELIDAQEEIRNLHKKPSCSSHNLHARPVQRTPSLRRMADVIDQVGGLHDQVSRISQSHAQQEPTTHNQPARSLSVSLRPKVSQNIPPQRGGSLHPTKLRSSEWVLMDINPAKVNASTFRPLQDGKMSHGRGHGLTK